MTQQTNNIGASAGSSFELRKIEEAFHRKLLEGIEYGFFEITARGTRINGRIEVYIEGGSSYKFAINEKKAGGSCGGSANEN